MSEQSFAMQTNWLINVVLQGQAHDCCPALLSVCLVSVCSLLLPWLSGEEGFLLVLWTYMKSLIWWHKSIIPTRNRGRRIAQKPKSQLGQSTGQHRSKRGCLSKTDRERERAKERERAQESSREREREHSLLSLPFDLCKTLWHVPPTPTAINQSTFQRVYKIPRAPMVY